MNKVAPAWTKERPRYSEGYNNTQERDHDDMDGPFVMAELKRALQICREKSSPGLDKID